jgi:hypothetical protein
MRIRKLNNSNVLRRGDLSAAAKLWRLSNSGLESGPVRFYRHRQEPVPWIHRVKHGKPFRHPRTTGERRAHLSYKATKEATRPKRQFVLISASSQTRDHITVVKMSIYGSFVADFLAKLPATP